MKAEEEPRVVRSLLPSPYLGFVGGKATWYGGSQDAEDADPRVPRPGSGVCWALSRRRSPRSGRGR